MKSEKRKQLKSLRNSLVNRENLSENIADIFLESELYKKAETLLLYYPAGSEVSTEKIFRQAMSDSKRTAFPVCIDTDGYMEFFYVNSENDLVEDMYGIKAPERKCEKFVGADNVLCLVPGLSFDKRGYRIGYGKGYYDRFLEGFSGISVGLCFEAMLEELLPTEVYDKKADYLITDKKIYKF